MSHLSWLCNTVRPPLSVAHSLHPHKVNNHNNKIIIRRCKRTDYNAVFLPSAGEAQRGHYSLFGYII